MGWERAGGEAVGLFDAVILDHDGTIVDSRDAMVRAYTRCNRCGRPHSVYRKFGLCRVCIRELALRGELPGVTKSSW